MHRTALFSAIVLAVAPLVAGQPATTPPPAAGPKQPTQPQSDELLMQYVRGRVDSVLTALSDTGDFPQAAARLQEVLDQCVAFQPELSPAPLAAVGGPLRMVLQLEKTPESRRLPMLAYLRKHPALAMELAFTVTRDDPPAAVYGVLETLRETFGDRPGEYPALTAAVCVVYDRGRSSAASNRPGATPEPILPADIFEHYLKNEGRLAMGVNSLPPDVLVYMVDSTAAIGELQWAIGKHAGDRNVGKRYHDIVYDTASLKFNRPKKISEHPYSLQNIARYGGVCAEQAYYAAHAGKAIGVPATVIGGRSGDMAHAWVGFLQSRGSLAWNMDEGHFGDYENLEGTVSDPQTGRTISDTRLAMTAEAARVPVEARHGAIVFTDAARRLMHLARFGEKSRAVYPPYPPQGIPGLREQPRPAHGPTQMELLDAALKLAPCSPDVWTAVQEVAPVMTGADRQAWFDKVSSACGQKYRRFAYHVTAAMIAGIADPSEQSTAWDWAFTAYRLVPDLAADARMRQGASWEKAGEKDKALACYVDVVQKFPNDGPFVVDALGRAEALLRAAKREDRVVELYKDAFRRISRPDNVSAQFFAQSNFFRVGSAYAAALERMNRRNDAAAVRRQLEAGMEKEGRK